MRKSIITSAGAYQITAEEENGRITGLFLENPGETSLVGRIYVGRVKHIMKNIHAAFIDIGRDTMCYYPLEDWDKYPIRGMEDKPLHEGDDILIQIEKDALKTKLPMATTRLSLTGHYLVLMTGKKGISFSSKIKNIERKEILKQILLSPDRKESYGLIVRTNSGHASEKAVLAEKRYLTEKMDEIFSCWNTRKNGTLLYEPEPAFLTEIFNNQLSFLDEVVTDDRIVFDILQSKVSAVKNGDPGVRLPSVRFYDDSYPLCKLYSLETTIERATKERVWLKSGGSLIIQPTEALVSIDVNTGKFDGKKKMEETFFKTNLEAAEEIAVQLKLRNLSGIIIVDFIDMSDEAHKEELLRIFEKALEKDPVKTTLVGFTRLNLVELTRKKVRKPLHEILKKQKPRQEIL